ncbi:aminotransferase class III-fold pyridoxal phosphate-dependent enzyme [Bacillus sp. C11]|nr:aminotransferase class III-fold pyridoxal phosphate-dependent enzyme [Neobacillus terrae]
MVLKNNEKTTFVQTTRNGKKLLVTGIPVFDANKEIFRIVSYSHDVTELLEMEKYLIQMKGEKERVKKKIEPVIGSIRSVGLMIGIEIVHSDSKEPNGEGLVRILDLALEKGVLFYLCGNFGEVIRMIPPLTVNQEQIDEGLQMLDEALYAYEREIHIFIN